MESEANTWSTLIFKVNSIDCIACSPVFKRELQKIVGVRSIAPLVLLNKFKVEYDSKAISRDELREKIAMVSKRLGDVIVFDH